LWTGDGPQPVLSLARAPAHNDIQPDGGAIRAHRPMQFTLIFVGWLAIALNNPTPALVLLIADLHSHRRERGTSTKSGK